jgi:long-chain acyl-CoA synthetase
MFGFISSATKRLGKDELYDRVRRGATLLHRHGIGPGHAVALLLRNDIAYLTAMLAIQRVGAFAVPLNWNRGDRVLAHILRDSAARLVVAHDDLSVARADLLRGCVVLRVRTPPEIVQAYDLGPQPARDEDWDSLLEACPPREEKADSCGSLFYTSGSTGFPKGVQREPLDVDARAAMRTLRRSWFGFEPGMSTIACGPLYHSVQTSYALAALDAGGRTFLHPRFDALTVLRCISEERITHLHLVPTMMRRLLALPSAVREQHDVSSLTFVVHGAAPCPPEIKRALIEWWGPIVHEYYGTTEIGMISRCDSHEWLARPGTVGRPMADREVVVLDSSGARVASGQVGTVYSSRGRMPRFRYRNTASRGRDDGLTTSGDRGWMDDDGYLYLVGRSSELILCGGANVYPATIEAEIAGYPDVEDCIAFGLPDDDLGEVVGLAVLPAAGKTVSSGAILDFLRPRLSRQELPRRIFVRDHLPRDPAGKAFRHQLREELLSP